MIARARPSAVDRDVDRQVHAAEHGGQQEHRPPLRPGQPAQRRTGDRHQHHGGDPLPHGDHAHRSDGVEGPRTQRRATWLLSALAVIIAMPRERPVPRAVHLPEYSHGPTPGEMPIAGPAIRWTYGCRGAAPPCSARGGRRRHLHRGGGRAAHLAGVDLPDGGRPRAGAGRPGPAPDDARGVADRRRIAGRRARPPRGRGTRGDATVRRRGARDLRVGYAWAAFGRHTTSVQRRWSTAHPGSLAGPPAVQHPDGGPDRGRDRRQRAPPSRRGPADRVGAGRPRTPRWPRSPPTTHWPAPVRGPRRPGRPDRRRRRAHRDDDRRALAGTAAPGHAADGAAASTSG